MRWFAAVTACRRRRKRKNKRRPRSRIVGRYLVRPACFFPPSSTVHRWTILSPLLFGAVHVASDGRTDPCTIVFLSSPSRRLPFPCHLSFVESICIPSVSFLRFPALGVPTVPPHLPWPVHPWPSSLATDGPRQTHQHVQPRSNRTCHRSRRWETWRWTCASLLRHVRHGDVRRGRVRIERSAGGVQERHVPRRKKHARRNWRAWNPPTPSPSSWTSRDATASRHGCDSVRRKANGTST
mmetsp:Transcript_4894/g.31335  ORF Transcript_4894/g.31335 Transcript_4894/m.31335 type:complete len:239 (-) Transcript_4894:1939-2655(-)